MTLWLWVTGCLLAADSGLCVWYVGVVRHGAVTGSGKRPCQLHCSFRVSAYTPCAQLRRTGCRPCQTAPHRGPSPWWGKWKHDDRLVPFLIFMPFCVCKCLMSEDAFSWRFLIFVYNIFSQKETRDPLSPNQESRLNSTVCIQSELLKLKKLSMKTWSLHSDLWCCNTFLCPQITTGCADLVPAQSGGLILPLHASVWITGWLWWVW